MDSIESMESDHTGGAIVPHQLPKYRSPSRRVSSNQSVAMIILHQRSINTKACYSASRLEGIFRHTCTRKGRGRGWVSASGTVREREVKRGGITDAAEFNNIGTATKFTTTDEPAIQYVAV